MSGSVSPRMDVPPPLDSDIDECLSFSPHERYSYLRFVSSMQLFLIFLAFFNLDDNNASTFY